MAHDKHMGRLANQLRQRSGHDPGLDLRPPIRRNGMAAVECEVVAVLDDGLVAAPGQGHLDTQRREAEGLGIIGPVLADADRDRRRNVLGFK